MDRPNRRLSNRYFRHLMQAIEEELGSHSLHRMLRQAGLEGYLGELPPANDQVRGYASELANLGRMIREYYGHGARGSMNRIGRAAWRRMVAEAPPHRKLYLHLLRRLSARSRPRQVLQALLAEIGHPDGQLSLHPMDTDLVVVDRSSDFTYGQTAEENLCWTTLGMIQEALVWATGRDFDVEEITCLAVGEDACRFRVRSS